MVKVDFKEVLGLNHKLLGFVSKVVSSKATRRAHLNKKGEVAYYSYSLDTESVYGDYEKGELYCDEGIYVALDICHWGDSLEFQWNIYLVVIDENGRTIPVAEYLDSPHTEWVKQARHVVKDYFNGEELEEIELTQEPKKREEPRPSSGYSGKTYSGSKKPTEKKQPEPKSKKKKETTPQRQETPKKKKGGTGRSQEKTPLDYGYARLMTFTGMVIGVYKIKRHNKKYIEVETDKGTLRFTKSDGKQVDAQKPRYANKIEYNLDK